MFIFAGHRPLMKNFLNEMANMDKIRRDIQAPARRASAQRYKRLSKPVVIVLRVLKTCRSVRISRYICFYDRITCHITYVYILKSKYNTCVPDIVQSVEKNIWTEERRSDMRLEKTA
jgi:hypothetical protein